MCPYIVHYNTLQSIISSSHYSTCRLKSRTNMSYYYPKLLCYSSGEFSPCRTNNGGCQDLCLPTSDGRVNCSCRGDRQLLEDSTCSCKKEKLFNHFRVKFYKALSALKGCMFSEFLLFLPHQRWICRVEALMTLSVGTETVSTTAWPATAWPTARTSLMRSSPIVVRFLTGPLARE